MRGLLVISEGMPIGHLSITDAGVVRVFLTVQSLRLGKQEQEKVPQVTLKEKGETEAWKGDFKRKSNNVVALEKKRSFWRKRSSQQQQGQPTGPIGWG